MAHRLFSPLALGPVELRNRIVSTAHQTTLVHEHLPTDDFVAYHEAVSYTHLTLPTICSV